MTNTHTQNAKFQNIGKPGTFNLLSVFKLNVLFIKKKCYDFWVVLNPVRMKQIEILIFLIFN